MMRKILLSAVLASAAWTAGAKDPLIMTVDGTGVTRAEFEYLYNKNSRQQLEPQSLADYVEMFTLYKLKVADARAMGLDTLESFRREMEQYRRELAEPYMTDSTLVNSYIDEAKRRMHTEVEASHIMLLKTGDAVRDRRSIARLDSLRAAARNGGDFAKLAASYSDDRYSAPRGGALGYISPFVYPYDFETAAYSTPEGEISEVVESPVAYHIVLAGPRRPQTADSIPSDNAIRDRVLRAVSNPRDDRYRHLRTRRDSMLGSRHKARLYRNSLSGLAGRGITIDSLIRICKSDRRRNPALAEIDGEKISVSDFLSTLSRRDEMADSTALARWAEAYFSSKLVEAEEKRLYEEEPDYRNLMNEYHDGSLLYEASRINVWDKAAQDTEGLRNCFNSRRSSYKWDTPRVKGYLIQAVSDSVAGEVKARLKGVAEDEIIRTVRNEFQKTARAERILAPKGGNPLTDHLMFGGPKPEGGSSRYPVSFLFRERLISSPEEFSDVKGEVTADYQQILEQEWIALLRSTYPVKVNYKELKKVKEL